MNKEIKDLIHQIYKDKPNLRYSYVVHQIKMNDNFYYLELIVLWGDLIYPTKNKTLIQDKFENLEEHLIKELKYQLEKDIRFSIIDYDKSNDIFYIKDTKNNSSYGYRHDGKTSLKNLLDWINKSVSNNSK